MKRIFLGTVMTLIFFTAASGMAAHVITLKNGSTFTVDHYWYSDGRLYFYLYGGVVGFDKDAVRDIHPVEPVPPRPELAVVSKAAATTQIVIPEQNGQTPSNTYPKLAPQGTDVESERLKKDKLQLDSRAQNVLEALRRARKSNDQKAIKMQQKMFLELKQKEHELREKAKTIAGGHLPDWWDVVNSASPASP